MASLTIELPDELVRRLEGIAAAQHKSLEQLALERLSSLIDAGRCDRLGSPEMILRVMQEPPHLMAGDADELNAAINAGRLPVSTKALF